LRLIKVNLPRDHKLFLTGDFHEGTILQHTKGINEMQHMVMSSKNNFVVLTGDLAEAIIIDDKRYYKDTEDPNASVPLLQYKSIKQKLQPIRSRILVALDGNHDFKLSKYGNFVRDIFCKNDKGDEDICYGTYSCILSVHDKKDKLMYQHFITHGNGSINSAADSPIRRESNMQLTLKRKLWRKIGNCFLMAMAHSHKLIVAEPTKDFYLLNEGGKIKEHYTKEIQVADYIDPDMRYYINTGSFLRVYADEPVSGYVERMMLDPVQLGFPIVNVEDGIVTGVKKVFL